MAMKGVTEVLYSFFGHFLYIPAKSASISAALSSPFFKKKKINNPDLGVRSNEEISMFVIY